MVADAPTEIPEGYEGGAGADSATAAVRQRRKGGRLAQMIFLVHHSFLENMRYGIHRRRLKPAAIYS
jgi:hypothetical protein